MTEENYTVSNTFCVSTLYLDYYVTRVANSNDFRGQGSTYINEKGRKHTSLPKRGGQKRWPSFSLTTVTM